MREKSLAPAQVRRSAMVRIHLEVDGGGPSGSSVGHHLPEEPGPYAARAHGRDHVQLLEPRAPAPVLESPGEGEICHANRAGVARQEEGAACGILDGTPDGGLQRTRVEGNRVLLELGGQEARDISDVPKGGRLDRHGWIPWNGSQLPLDVWLRDDDGSRRNATRSGERKPPAQLSSGGWAGARSCRARTSRARAQGSPP